LNAFKDKIDADEVPGNNFNNKFVRGVLAEEDFTPEIIGTKSGAAAGVCDWIINICSYYDVFVSVEPKKKKVAEAKATLAEANDQKR